MARDPMCGREVTFATSKFGISLLHAGNMSFSFCSPECYGRFCKEKLPESKK